nr:MAG TPA: hypothetical protein [Caudoviricetes sp.]
MDCEFGQIADTQLISKKTKFYTDQYKIKKL